mmetsp:Transcript_53673/g.143566  ORF Transcript_53673/g.143566 Transcript_53673/m.143566 type:complete len:471 (-) Transcript_53673:559-1971(-)
MVSIFTNLSAQVFGNLPTGQMLTELSSQVFVDWSTRSQVLTGLPAQVFEDWVARSQLLTDLPFHFEDWAVSSQLLTGLPSQVFDDWLSRSQMLSNFSSQVFENISSHVTERVTKIEMTTASILDAAGERVEAFAADADGYLELMAGFAGWIALWLVLFYGLSYTEFLWIRLLPASTRGNLSSRYISARNILGIGHALFVTCLALPIFLSLPERMWFATSNHLATCAYPDGPESIATAGMAFTAFTAADIFISVVHGPITLDYMAHHLIFLVAGLIMRGNCVLPFNAAILLSMEASTPFLNLLLLVRHRTATLLPKLVGMLFTICFVFFRLILNVYGILVLWRHRSTALPASLPLWQGWILLSIIAAGAGVQFFWFPTVTRMFCRGMSKEIREIDWRQMRAGCVAIHQALSGSDGETERVLGGGPVRRRSDSRTPCGTGQRLYTIDEHRRVVHVPFAIGTFENVIRKKWVD